MIADAIKARLTSQVSLVGTRVYPTLLPQNPTYPAITYQQISRVPYSAMVSDRPDVEYRIQVNVWAERYNDAAAGALQVAAQVRTALQRYSGTEGGFEIVESFLANDFNLYEDEQDLHHVILDFTVWAES